jgi:protein CpxP
MNTQQAASTPSTARRWIIGGAAALVLGLSAAAGTSYAAGDGMGACMSMHGHHGPMDPAAMGKHVDAMVARVLKDGTDEQKAKLSAIVKSAMTDLHPLHTQLHDAHAQAVKLLSAPTVDKAALEQLRASQVQLVDTASKRVLQAVEEAADVLTPAQRTRLAEHLGKGMHH